MKIALLGYGKMGKVIEKIAINRGHEIIAAIDNEIQWKEKADLIQNAEVAIDFSTPKNILKNIENCFEINLPIVVGTTGWYDEIDRLSKITKQKNQALLWASNFSIGVNIFFKINLELARLMNKYDVYDVSVNEIHHTAKLDAPSGTAISIANEIISELDRKIDWSLGKSEKSNVLMINSERIDPTPGTHNVVYDSDIDSIEIIHTAKNRKGFATGAVIAAEWLKDKNGFYEFKEVFFKH